LTLLKNGLTLKEELRLRVFENRILKRIFVGPKRGENGEGKGSTMRKFIFCTVHLIKSEWLNLED
jgi:hypothetical protein